MYKHTVLKHIILSLLCKLVKTILQITLGSVPKIMMYEFKNKKHLIKLFND